MVQSHSTRPGPQPWSPLAWACFFSLLLIIPVDVGHGEDSDSTIAKGQPGFIVAPFELPAVSKATQGESTRPLISLEPDPDAMATVICFLGAECPLARLYGPRLNDLAKEFGPRGVRFWGINSNRQDSWEDIQTYVKDQRITFPLSKDYQNVVADQFAAQRTPEVFVLDATLTIRYRGRIDDQYEPGLARPQPARHDLRQAIEALLAGKPVDQPITEASGCLIGRVKKSPLQPGSDSKLTFAKQVSRVLNQHCVECHRAGEIGPFALTDYEEVVGWADTILEAIADRRMPPWHAAGDQTTFVNARHMPEHDKQVLRDWVAAGAPFGDPADLPDLPAAVTGWQLAREPDQILPMRTQPFTVPATGTVEYQYFVVDPGFENDRWITAAQVVPGSRAVVHHAICFIRPPDGARFRGVGWLTAYVPGQRGVALPPGAARFVPAGSKLVFQMHYTPNGSQQQDLTKIGLLFGRDDEVTHEVYTIVAIDQEFEIPPHAANHKVTTTVTRLAPAGELFALVPHMHVRGKSMQISALQGDEERLVLDVPRYDFNWQHSYHLKQPLPLAAMDKIKMTATFDNSAGNATNPDPTQHVTWGDQTWQEMAIAFLEVSEPRDAKSQRQPRIAKEDPIDKSTAVKSFVATFLQRFDGDGDGAVDRDETPLSFQRFGFHRFDQNNDGQLSNAEIRRAAVRQF